MALNKYLVARFSTEPSFKRGPNNGLLNNVWLRGAYLLLITALIGVSAPAQINKYLSQGNQLYDQQKYKEAAADYAKALAKDPNNQTGMFNLGNSYYQQKQYDSSRKIMETTAKMTKDKTGQAAANYNIGNTYMAQQKWEDAINAYKETLRRNPQDPDAKYNLSYAEEMMKKQQQDQKNKDKNKQDKNKDKKDQKDKDKQKQDDKGKDKDKKDKDQQDKGDKDKQDKDQQPQGQPSKLTPQQADQLLNALQQDEKKLQDKMKKEKGVPMKMQKDW
jgi:Ca-activated chloride channel family protein